jgi:Domain of unknown function (DUF6321)
MEDNLEIEQLFNELSNIESSMSIKEDASIEVEDSFEIGEPIYDEYYSSMVFDYLSDQFSAEEKSAKPKLKNPKGGLTAAGRAHFKRTEGANLKPGVKGPADTPEKMRRKGSFLTRFFTNPSGPMKDEKGRATRLALSAAAWGEPVPGDAAAAAKLAAKGRRLLERYENTKKKSDDVELDEKQLPGQTIGQQQGGGIGATAQGSLDAIDHDGDGMINDGTPEEQRAPYKRQSNSDYEKRRRKFVRGQLVAQGIKPNRDVADRSAKERDARARARAAFDKQTVRSGAEAQAQIGRANTEAARDRRNQAQSDRLTGQAQRSSAADRKPADRIDNSPPARRIDAADRALANRGRTTGVSDAATRRGQTDSRRPTSADDRRRPDSIDKGTGNRVAGDQPVRVGRQAAPAPSDAATRRGQTDSRRPTSADDRRRPDSVDRGSGNRVAGDQPVRVGRQEAQGTRDAATRRGQTDSRRPTSADDTRGADRTDRSNPNRMGDAGDRARANRGTSASDAATRRGQTDSRRPTSADDRRMPDRTDRSKPQRNRMPIYKTDGRPSRMPIYETENNSRTPIRQTGKTSGRNRQLRDF